MSFLIDIINLLKPCNACFLLKKSDIKLSLYSFFCKFLAFNSHVFLLNVNLNKYNKLLYSLKINFLSKEQIP